MKQGKYGVGEIAGIILIIMILVILIVSFTGLYGQSLTDSIKKLFGIKTEAEEYRESNIKGEDCFDNLIEDIKRCKGLKTNNCGCTVNLGCFSKSQRIKINSIYISLEDIGNIKEKKIYEKEGNQLKNSEIRDINCALDKNLKLKNSIKIKGDMMVLSDLQIYFNKEKPELNYICSTNWIRQLSYFGSGYCNEFLDSYNLYKTGNNICWLQETNKIVNECK